MSNLNALCRTVTEISMFKIAHILTFHCHLEMEYRLFPTVKIFVNLFPRAGYFFNAFD